MIWSCPRCHYATSKTSCVLQHLNRIKNCPSHFSDETTEEIKASFDARLFECPHCKRQFTDARHLSRHDTFCIKKEMAVMRQTIEELKQPNTVNNNTTTINVINNNNNNSNNIININIVVNNFGSEDRSYITKEDMLECLDTMKIKKLVDSIYFHPDHPENHTIKLKSEKKKRVIIRNEGNWVEEDMNTSIDSIMHRENSSLSSYFYDNIWPDESINYENKAWTHKKLMMINDKNKEFFEQRRGIQAKLKNGVNSSEVTVS